MSWLPLLLHRVVPLRRPPLLSFLAFFALLGVLSFCVTRQHVFLEAHNPHPTPLPQMGVAGDNGWLDARLRRVSSGCARAGPHDDDDAALPGYRRLAADPRRLANILVNDQYKVLYCYLPKVACTNWKKVLLSLNLKNVTDVGQINSDSVHRKDVFLKLSALKEEDILARLQTYNKFVVVRHPFERLVSAFRNKFVMNYTSSAYFKKRYGVAILKRFHKLRKMSPGGGGVQFAEFVQYLIETFDQNSFLLNEHWAPYSQLCQPCDVRYNLIGKYETLEKDARYILQRIGAPASVHFPPIHYSKTSVLVESYLSTLTVNQLEHLLRIFKQDFTFFDYHFRKV